RPRMGRTLSGFSRFVYGLIVFLGVVGETVLLVVLFVSGRVVAGLIFLFVGGPILLTVVHWVGLLVAAPFALAGGAIERQYGRGGDEGPPG
ncbi:MAG: hypothetical protein ACYCYA_13930, partial [Actinomycetes bacterium]